MKVRPYPPEIETEIKKFYQTLSEKDKRRYAAVEALKLGHGGIVYIANLVGCNRDTIHEGTKELKTMPSDSSYDKRVRRPGGGRKSYEETYPDIDAKFLDVLAEYTAGDPMNEQVRWTNLSAQEIADRLLERHDIAVSITVTNQLLDKHGYRRRKIQKKDHERQSTSECTI